MHAERFGHFYGISTAAFNLLIKLISAHKKTALTWSFQVQNELQVRLSAILANLDKAARNPVEIFWPIIKIARSSLKFRGFIFSEILNSKFLRKSLLERPRVPKCAQITLIAQDLDGDQ